MGEEPSFIDIVIDLDRRLEIAKKNGNKKVIAKYHLNLARQYAQYYEWDETALEHYDKAADISGDPKIVAECIRFCKKASFRRYDKKAIFNFISTANIWLDALARTENDRDKIIEHYETIISNWMEIGEEEQARIAHRTLKEYIN